MQSESDMKNRAVSAAEGSRSTQRVVVGWRERRVMLMSFLHEIRIHPRLSIGFGLFWTWVWLVFQTTLFSPAFLNELDFILPGWVVPLTAYALTFLLLGFLFKLKGIVPQGRWYLICVSATMSVGVGICGMLSYSPLTVFSINAVVTCFGGVLMGAGTACLHVEWGRVLGELGPRITILHGVVGTVVAALLTVCITFLPDIAVWIVAVMAAGYLVLAVVSPDAPEGLFIHTLGYRFVDIMMWALCTFLINQRGLPANWVFAITTCFLLLGQVVGALIGSGVVYTFDITVHTARDLATVMVFVLLAVSLVMSDRKNLQTGWGMVRPGELNEMPDSFDRACELVGRRYALTSREQEIFSMLARGSSRADICEELTLSKETVKTHVRNIYRKMGIHSQQDTLAAVVAEQQALGIDEPPEETDMRI